jgi:hypothetical protein
MPQVPFDRLPDDARVWVFAAPHPIDAGAATAVLEAVDAFLHDWNAHGHPLLAGRDLRDSRFLAIGVDQSAAGASGCSIDGLFRVFKDVESRLGVNLMPAGRVFWRGGDGTIVAGSRAEFASNATASTAVFDTTVASAGEWRRAFERPASSSWHAQILTPRRAGSEMLT